MSENQFQLEGDAPRLDEKPDFEDDPLDDGEVQPATHSQKSPQSQKKEANEDSKPIDEQDVHIDDDNLTASPKGEREPNQIVMATQSSIMNQKKPDQDEDQTNQRTEKESVQRTSFQSLLMKSKTVPMKPVSNEVSKILENDAISSKTNPHRQKSVRHPTHQPIVSEHIQQPVKTAQEVDSKHKVQPKVQSINTKSQLEKSSIKEKARFKPNQSTNNTQSVPKNTEVLTKSSPEKKKEFFLKGNKPKLVPREISTDAKENRPVEKLPTHFATPKYPILHLKNFDELNYLKKRLTEAESDKAELKKELQVVETNITQLRSQIHRLLLKREADFQKSLNTENLTEVSNSGNIELLQKIQADKAHREMRQLSLQQKLRDREEDVRRQVEMKESQLKERLLSEKKQRIEENISAIRQRASIRAKKNRMANKLISVLLNSSQVMNNSLRQSQQLHQELRTTHA